MFAATGPIGVVEAALSSITGWNDATAIREGILAALLLAVYIATAPRGKRRLAWMSIGLLGIACVVLGLLAVFPRPDVAGGGHAHHVLRFFLVASALQSVLVIVGVSVWERLWKPLPKIFLDIVRVALLVLALFVVMWDAGIEPGGLLTGSAVLTAVLGFALRDTLGNVFAGLAIHAEHPFEVGDWIQYDTNQAHIGKVVEVNWRATKVLTLDDAYVIVPNGQLAQASIRNFTKPDPWSRRSVYVTAPYSVSPQKVQRIILEAMRGSFGVLEHPAPSVVTNAFTERGIEYWVRLFTNDFDKRDRVDGMVRDRIWFALARHGIEIPTATQSIRLTEVAPAGPPEPAETAIERRVESLERVGLLDVLGPAQVRRLAGDSRELRFAGAEPVIRQGDPGDSMFIILDGNVEVTAAEEGGAAVVVARLGPGDYFGEMSLMTGAARTATVVALAETRVLEVRKEAFGAIVGEKPELLERLSSALADRLEERRRALVKSGRVPDPPPPDLLKRIHEFFSS